MASTIHLFTRLSVHPLSLHPFTLLSKQPFLLWFGAFKTLRHFEGGSRDLQVIFSIFFTPPQVILGAAPPFSRSQIQN